MLAAYQAFLAYPSAENYLAARESLRHSEATVLGAVDWSEIARQCREGRFSAAGRKLDRLLPTWILSPRYHFYAGSIAEERGEREAAELARFQFQACLDGLSATGRGTA